MFLKDLKRCWKKFVRKKSKHLQIRSKPREIRTDGIDLRRKKFLRKQSPSIVTKIDLDYRQEDESDVSQTSRIAPLPSSPSQIRTEDLTDIYRCQTGGLTVDEVLKINGYRLGQELGKGSYAIVYRTKNLLNNTTVACKVIDVSQATKNQSLSVKNELFILEQTYHPHIIQLYRHFIIESTNIRRVYIFMQLAKESLSVYMRRMDVGLEELLAKKWFAQIVSALNHMHQKGIAHRDIKMGNILLDQTNDCLVTDFGLSRIAFRESKGGKILSNKYCGTVPYMAPEIILTKDYILKYDPFAADIWALGVLLYCLINHGYPFCEGTRMIRQQLSRKIKFSRKIRFEPTKDLIDLLQQLLEPNPDQRIKINQLIEHRWFKKQFDDVEIKVRIFIQAAQQDQSESKTSQSRFSKTRYRLFTRNPSSISSRPQISKTPSQQIKSSPSLKRKASRFRLPKPFSSNGVMKRNSSPRSTQK
ncbi:protein kinase-like protein 1 [Sarcoptes scabiei]|uniref:Protein kinase-like protein 1 n=1 Tax=Sarcoptes scabiei TaxID=52283 RepID=A0A131ZUL2_SARSC|nr:protein kinase-like protein 1 [Sarcoptes scabiei]